MLLQSIYNYTVSLYACTRPPRSPSSHGCICVLVVWTVHLTPINSCNTQKSCDSLASDSQWFFLETEPLQFCFSCSLFRFLCFLVSSRCSMEATENWILEENHLQEYFIKMNNLKTKPFALFTHSSAFSGTQRWLQCWRFWAHVADSFGQLEVSVVALTPLC